MYEDFLRLDLLAGASIIGFADDALVVCAAEDVRIVMDKRSFQYPKIVLGEHEVEWKTSIKYLGVQLGRRLSFGEHLQIATAKVIQCGANLTRLMFSAQRSIALRIVSAYRTVSMSAVLVLASVSPIDLLAEERKETFLLRKTQTC